jgi:hypothetical protein
MLWAFAKLGVRPDAAWMHDWLAAMQARMDRCVNQCAVPSCLHVCSASRVCAVDSCFTAPCVYNMWPVG